MLTLRLKPFFVGYVALGRHTYGSGSHWNDRLRMKYISYPPYSCRVSEISCIIASGDRIHTRPLVSVDGITVCISNYLARRYGSGFLWTLNFKEHLDLSVTSRLEVTIDGALLDKLQVRIIGLRA